MRRRRSRRKIPTISFFFLFVFLFCVFSFSKSKSSWRKLVFLKESKVKCENSGEDEKKCCFQCSLNFPSTSFVVCFAIIGKQKQQQQHQFLNLIPFFRDRKFTLFLIKSLSLVGINESVRVRKKEEEKRMLNEVKLFDVIKTPSFFYF